MSGPTLSSPRRTLGWRWLATALLVACALLAGCAVDSAAPGSTPTPSAAVASGPFTFTDDRGKTVTLPEKPKRIVVQSAAGAALWDLGVRPVGVFGPQRLSDGSADPQVGNIDLSTTESLGEVYGEFSVEKLAELKPDLIITTVYSDLLWYVPEKAQASIEKLAPIVGIELEGKSIPVGIARFSELAAAIGADVNSAEVQQAKVRFDTASTRFSAAVKAKEGLEVVTASASDANYYVGDPTYLGGLKYLVELGLPHPSVKAEGGAWQALSWEQVDVYPGDVFLVDNRTAAVSKTLQSKPTWKALPAVQAGQTYPWNPETPYSYDLFAEDLDAIAGEIERARADLAS